jgi:hypothetical protein
MLRATLLIKINEVENEIGRLRTVVAGGLAGELRAVSKQLVDLARRVNRARKALRQESLQERARALKGVLESIRCEFEAIRIYGGKVQHRLAKVRFVPLLGEEVCMDVAHSSDAAPCPRTGGPDAGRPSGPRPRTRTGSAH